MKDIKVSFPEPCAERWDDMAPRGCNRHCASCDKIIHDLSAMTVEEVENLIENEPEPCVRAVIGSDGEIRSRSGRASHRIVAAALSSTLAFGVAACETTGAVPQKGHISGRVTDSCWSGKVIAIAADGKQFAARVGMSGRYKLRYLPVGDYRLQYVDSAGTVTEGDRVTVARSTTTTYAILPEDECIVVGMLKRANYDG